MNGRAWLALVRCWPTFCDELSDFSPAVIFFKAGCLSCVALSGFSAHTLISEKEAVQVSQSLQALNGTAKMKTVSFTCVLAVCEQNHPRMIKIHLVVFLQSQ